MAGSWPFKQQRQPTRQASDTAFCCTGFASSPAVKRHHAGGGAAAETVGLHLGPKATAAPLFSGRSADFQVSPWRYPQVMTIPMSLEISQGVDAAEYATATGRTPSEAIRMQDVNIMPQLAAGFQSLIGIHTPASSAAHSAKVF